MSGSKGGKLKAGEGKLGNGSRGRRVLAGVARRGGIKGG